VTALPWLGGARAPWWRDDAGAAFLGLSAAHDSGDLARAAVEAVAWDVQRCVEAMGPAGTVTALALAGGGSEMPVWVEVVTSVTGLAAARRRSGEAASAGAAVLTGRAIGDAIDIDVLNPVSERVSPDAVMVAAYRRLRGPAERAAAAGLSLTERTGPGAAPPG
jgi:xylulokinase